MYEISVDLQVNISKPSFSPYILLGQSDVWDRDKYTKTEFHCTISIIVTLTYSSDHRWILKSPCKYRLSIALVLPRSEKNRFSKIFNHVSDLQENQFLSSHCLHLTNKVYRIVWEGLSYLILSKIKNSFWPLFRRSGWTSGMEITTFHVLQTCSSFHYLQFYIFPLLEFPRYSPKTSWTPNRLWSSLQKCPWPKLPHLW